MSAAGPPQRANRSPAGGSAAANAASPGVQPLPLTGVRVIDYSHFLAGPHMSRVRSAIGAEVIKVERPPAGDPGRAAPGVVDGVSGYYLQQNMGKEGLC